MKIKSVENFTFEECREYLNQNPNGTERAAVEDRMNTILKQNAYTKEQEDKHKRLEQNQYENDVKWIDIKQFLANRKYRKFSGLKNLFFALLNTKTDLTVIPASLNTALTAFPQLFSVTKPFPLEGS